VYGPPCLTEGELAPSYDLRKSLSLLMLFQLLRADVGIEYSLIFALHAFYSYPCLV
jgi:hypothetical protein